jgi:predicted amidophosphoribosyltransferase
VKERSEYPAVAVARYYPKRRKFEHLKDQFSQELLRLKKEKDNVAIYRVAYKLSSTVRGWLGSKIEKITLLTYPPSSRQRSYYFVRELAQTVGAELDIECLEFFQWKEKVSSQGKRVLRKKERISKKMLVKPQLEKIVEGESILLIDDILTTGLTALAAVKALREAKAGEVYVACLGWTVDTAAYHLSGVYETDGHLR